MTFNIFPQDTFFEEVLLNVDMFMNKQIVFLRLEFVHHTNILRSVF